MNRSGTTGERCLALFLLGLLLLSPPLLSLFSREHFIGGIPLLYVYLFCAWGLLIVLIGATAAGARRSRRGGRGPRPERRQTGDV